MTYKVNNYKNKGCRLNWKRLFEVLCWFGFIACAGGIALNYTESHPKNASKAIVEANSGNTCPAELPLNGATSYESKDIPRDTIDRDGRGDLFDKYFGKDARVMRAVCEAENQEKNPLTIGDLKHTFWQGGKQYGMSVGLCQVRIMPDRNITIEEMQNPEHNIEYSKHALFDHGGFKHWTKYNNGEYKRFLK